MISEDWYQMDELNAKAVFFTAVAAAAAGVNVWFVGPPGRGKSVFVKQLAKFLRYGEEPYSFMCIELQYGDPGSHFGVSLPGQEGNTLKMAVTESLAQTGRHPYLLLFDEFNYAPSDVQAYTNELLAFGQIEMAGFKLHEGTRLFAASNDTRTLVTANTLDSTLSRMLVLRYPVLEPVDHDSKAEYIYDNLMELQNKVQDGSLRGAALYEALEKAIEEAIQKHEIDPETRFCLAKDGRGKVHFLNFEPNIEVISRLAANDTVGVDGKAIDITKLDPVLLKDQMLQRKVKYVYKLIQNEISQKGDRKVDESFSNWIENGLGSRLVPSNRTAEIWRSVVLALCRMYEVGAINRNELDCAIRHASLGTIGDLVITSLDCNVSQLMTILLDLDTTDLDPYNQKNVENLYIKFFDDVVNNKNRTEDEQRFWKAIMVGAFNQLVASRIMNDIERALRSIKMAAANGEKANDEKASEEIKQWIDKLATAVTPLVVWSIRFDDPDPKREPYRKLLLEISAFKHIFKTDRDLYFQLTEWLSDSIEQEIGKGTKVADIVKERVFDHVRSVREELKSGVGKRQRHKEEIRLIDPECYEVDMR